MNNDKLLRALIDALGFDIEEVREFDEPAFSASLISYQQYSMVAASRGGGLTTAPPQAKDFTNIEYKLVKRVDDNCSIQDYKLLGFADREEAYTCYSNHFHVKACSFDMWIDWIKKYGEYEAL